MGGVDIIFGAIDLRERSVVGVGEEWFCQIKLSVCISSETRVLADFNWDAKEIFGWFERNQEYICKEERPVWCVESTIAGSVKVALESDEVDDAGLDEIYEYRLKHDLRFAARGARVPSIYFGRGVAGGELSVVIDEEIVCVSIDFSDLYFKLGQQKRYVSEKVKNNYLEV